MSEKPKLFVNFEWRSQEEMTPQEWTTWALNEICDPHDGPITEFVMVSRAIKLARAGTVPVIDSGVGEFDPLIEALYRAMEHGERPGSGA